MALTKRPKANWEDAHLIDALVGCTMSAAVCRWLLRNRLEKMTVTDIRECNKEIRKAKQDRANIFRQLNLDVRPDPWELIDSTVKPNGQD